MKIIKNMEDAANIIDNIDEYPIYKKSEGRKVFIEKKTEFRIIEDVFGSVDERIYTRAHMVYYLYSNRKFFNEEEL